MKFDFSYGGGFTGLNYHLSGDSDDLDPSHKEKLEQISNFDPANLKKSNPLAKDLFKYKLNIHDKDREVSLNFTDDNIPSEYESLISHLRQKATLAT